MRPFTLFVLLVSGWAAQPARAESAWHELLGLPKVPSLVSSVAREESGTQSFSGSFTGCREGQKIDRTPGGALEPHRIYDLRVRTSHGKLVPARADERGAVCATVVTDHDGQPDGRLVVSAPAGEGNTVVLGAMLGLGGTDRTRGYRAFPPSANGSLRWIPMSCTELEPDTATLFVQAHELDPHSIRARKFHLSPTGRIVAGEGDATLRGMLGLDGAPKCTGARCRLAR